MEQMKNTEWKTLGARPIPVVMGLGVDSNGKTLILHRSDQVRSAKNTWSLPSGLMEAGMTREDQLRAEFKEELGVELVGGMSLLTVYEAIRPEDGFHWVIFLYICSLKEWAEFVNLEPEKHDEVKLLSMVEFCHEASYNSLFDPVLAEALRECLKSPMALQIFWNSAREGTL